MNRKKMIIFGAGKIGRSFIGQIFSRSGYEVVFVDIDKPLIDRINQRRQYRVVIKDRENEEILNISNVSGLYLDDEARLTAEISSAGIISVSVGQKGLQAVIPVLAKALIARRQQFGDIPLDVIIAENMRDADVFIRDELKKQMPEDYPLAQLVGLVETSIGKMAPIMTRKDIEEDPLQGLCRAL